MALQVVLQVAQGPADKASEQIDALLTEVKNNKTALMKSTSNRLGTISLEIKRLLKITNPTISQVELDRQAKALLLEAMQ